ncbi:MAG: helix-turn-helix domain-containing protein [Butyricicoccus sp.]|nr:helix-turn-helix domain-containing protein [Butyricicoccus sp.]
MSYEYWMGKHFSYYFNRECEYFPCHLSADPENFNCLFCYCPLYVLGDQCGGTFVYLENGFKDCSLCLFPHLRENYGKIIDRYQEILTRMPERRQHKAPTTSEPWAPDESVPQTDRQDGCATEREKDAVEKAVHYIHENLTRSISLDDLAKEVGLSRYYFAHAFKKLTGASPIEYTQHARLEQTKRYLADTSLPLLEIAPKVGYHSASALSTLFRKKLHMTPSEYRKQARPEEKNAR